MFGNNQNDLVFFIVVAQNGGPGGVVNGCWW
jgi:hypothetical protein